MQKTDGKSILVIEDESIIALDISQILLGLGYQVTNQVRSADQAYASVSQQRPDLALVDIRLSGLEDGIQLAQRLRLEFDIPIVFLTANADIMTIQRALTSDASGFLVKPINPPMMYATIEMALRRHASERALRTSEDRYRMLFQGMVQGVTIRDRESRIIALNQAATRIYGKAESDLIGTRPLDEFDVLDTQGNPIPFEQLPVQQVIATGRPVEGFILQVKERATGRIRWHKINAFPRDSSWHSQPEEIVSIFEDITEKQLTEQALLESERNFRLLAENVRDVIWQFDLKTMKFTYVSPSVYKLRGITVQEALQETLQDSVDPASYEMVIRNLPQRIEAFSRHGGEENVSIDLIRQRHKDGSLIWVEMVSTMMAGEDGSPSTILGISRDVTERIRDREELRASQDRYRALFNGVIDGIAIHEIGPNGESGTIIEVNDILCQMRDRQRSDLIGQNISVLSSVPDSVDTPEFQSIVQRLASGADVLFERELRRHDGLIIPVEIHAQSFKDGDKLFAFSVLRDIRERKRVEAALQSLNIELEERVRERTIELEDALKELETFAYSVSHDLKTPLRAIEGFSQILLDDYSANLDPEGLDYLKRVRRAAIRMGQLIDDLLDYSRLERKDLILGPVNLPRLIEHLLMEFFDGIHQRGVSVKIALGCNEVVAEPDALAQALRNLIENALKFSSVRDNPILEIGSSQTDEKSLIWVKDNGIGFDMAYHDQIFDVFTRLHREGEYPGTGVGLAIVRKAMHRIKGRVWAESKPEKGAVFYLELPR
jgi:PAS domain S-box-containing protein